MKTYKNNDPRLGESMEFTMQEMIDLYRSNHWDIFENGSKMTDQEIIDDVLNHDVEEV